VPTIAALAISCSSTRELFVDSFSSSGSNQKILSRSRKAQEQQHHPITVPSSTLHTTDERAHGTTRTCLSMAADSRALRFYGNSLAEQMFSVANDAEIRLPFFSEAITNRITNGDSNRPSPSNGSDRNGSTNNHHVTPPVSNDIDISLTKAETELFKLLRQVTKQSKLKTSLRVAGGWVRDKLLATEEFREYHTSTLNYNNPKGQHQRLTSKFHKPAAQASMGRQGTKVISSSPQPVDIDIALDDMLGREFADSLNEYLTMKGRETISVGVVLKNPEKSKHLETATMKVGPFWIDFVNLRAEEYTQDSRIPDLMRIGSPAEDSYRRDLTINSLFYNINTQKVEDWTGHGIQDLKRGVVSTPLAPLTTLLDDPLRVMRSVRFAARLRFRMDDALVRAAKDTRVKNALAQKVSRERIGCEVDLMFRSPDPVGAMRLLNTLNLTDTVFPLSQVLPLQEWETKSLFTDGLNLLSATFEHMCDSKVTPPVWCEKRQATTTHGYVDRMLLDNDEARRLLWYAAYFKPLWDAANLSEDTRKSPYKTKKKNRSVVTKVLVDYLKRPAHDAERVETIIRAANDFTTMIRNGFDVSATSILLGDIEVHPDQNGDGLHCSMSGHEIDSEVEDDPLWKHAMEFRFLTSKVVERCDDLWRAALMLSLSQELKVIHDEFGEYVIEGDVIDETKQTLRHGAIERYDVFAVTLQRLGLIGIWGRKPLLDGVQIKRFLPNIPRGPVFGEIMDEQERWMTTHPNGGVDSLAFHLQTVFPEFAGDALMV